MLHHVAIGLERRIDEEVSAYECGDSHDEPDIEYYNDVTRCIYVLITYLKGEHQS